MPSRSINRIAVKRAMQPEHPGAVLRSVILPELAITQLELAERLGVSRRTISEVLREKRPVTSDMAMRLARVFNTTPKFWLNLQVAVDLWNLENKKGKDYAKLKPLASAKTPMAS